MSFVFEKQWAISKWKDDLTSFRMHGVIYFYTLIIANHVQRYDAKNKKNYFKFTNQKWMSLNRYSSEILANNVFLFE